VSPWLEATATRHRKRLEVSEVQAETMQRRVVELEAAAETHRERINILVAGAYTRPLFSSM